MSDTNAQSQTAAISKQNYSFLAVLTTTSPLHITEPSSDRIQLDGRVISGDAGFPYARTTKMWVNPSPLVTTQDESSRKSGSLLPVPCIPSNTLAGLLRRRAARAIFDHIVKRGEKLSIDAYNVLECGAASGKPDKANPTVKEIVAASLHPYFGLFGGGPRLLRRKLRVDTALAITEVTQDYLHTHFHDATSPKQLLGNVWQRRNDDLLHVVDPKTQSLVIADFLPAVNAYQDGRSTDKVVSEESDKSSSGLDRFNALEHVSPGVHFALRFDIEDATPAQAGLFLHSLLSLAKLNRIGGQGRRGFGRFILQKVVVEVEGESKHLASRIVAGEGELSDAGKELLDAWSEASVLVTAGEIEAYAKSMDVADDKEGKKKGKKGKAEAAEDQAEEEAQ